MTDQQLATTEQKPRPSMTVGGNVGALIPQDIDQAFRIAQALAHSGMTPNGFKSPETCFVAIMAGAELGLPPFQSLQSFAIINNRPTLWGDALMAVVRTNGFKVREWLEGAGDDMEAFCEVIRPDNGDVAEASFSVSDAKTAGLWKKGGPWTTNPKRMLKMRARAFAIRDGAADVLRGFQIREEVEDYGDPIPANAGPAKVGSGLLAKLEANQTLATEGFGIRDIQEEAGEAAPAPEPAAPKKRARKATVANEALAAIADAEPEIVKQVVEDHGHPLSEEELAVERAARTRSAMRFYEKHGRRPTSDDFDGNDDPENPTPLLDSDVGRSDDLLGRNVSQADVDAQYGHADAVEVIHEGPAPADTVYFMAEDEVYPSGRRAVYFNGLPNGVVEATDDHPTYTQQAPVKAKDKSTDSAPAENAQEIAESQATTEEEPDIEPDTHASSTTPAEASPFDIFDAAARDATDWPELSTALTALSRTPEWKADAVAKRAARLKAWAKVCDWNEDGAKLDPARSANLFQIAVTAYSDPEVVQGLYATAQGEPWLAEADDGMQAGVARFVLDRLSEIRGA